METTIKKKTTKTKTAKKKSTETKLMKESHTHTSCRDCMSAHLEAVYDNGIIKGKVACKKMLDRLGEDGMEMVIKSKSCSAFSKGEHLADKELFKMLGL